MGNIAVLLTVVVVMVWAVANNVNGPFLHKRENTHIIITISNIA